MVCLCCGGVIGGDDGRDGKIKIVSLPTIARKTAEIATLNECFAQKQENVCVFFHIFLGCGLVILCFRHTFARPKERFRLFFYKKSL